MDTMVETAQAGGAFYEEPIRIVASDEVRSFVRERGGRLYVWMVAHRSVRATHHAARDGDDLPARPD